MVGKSCQRFVPIALGCCLIVACVGCHPRPRHGLILRGDFAVELNRIPWLKERGADYQYPGPGGAECGAPCDCGSPAMSGEGSARGACRQGVGAGQPVAEVGYHNQPRFHPVPTRPVFLGRGGLYPTMEAPMSPAAPEPEVIPAPAARPIRGARAPSPPPTAQGPSWIFQPSADRQS